MQLLEPRRAQRTQRKMRNEERLQLCLKFLNQIRKAKIDLI